MNAGATQLERFSGHESFVCRYGWLPKVFRAVSANPHVLKNEESAMNVLGIGRNMVKSIQFWGEAAGIITSDGKGNYVAGRVGSLLLGQSGWDPYLETPESLWLVHWQLSTNAGLAAWNEVFGEGALVRFDRRGLVDALAKRGAKEVRNLASSTLEQHASIFIQSYYQAERNADDTSWCPLQDLNLIKATKGEDGRVSYSTDQVMPLGLSTRVFGMALIDYMVRRGHWAADLKHVLRESYSPGVVFRLDEHHLRQFISITAESELKGALRFVDTADTQSIVISPKKLDPQYALWSQEALEHA